MTKGGNVADVQADGKRQQQVQSNTNYKAARTLRPAIVIVIMMMQLNLADVVAVVIAASLARVAICMCDSTSTIRL